jgi:signal transduction histidine kinase
MMLPQQDLPGPFHSLSARLLVLTIFFVMLSEVLIFAPSVARFRLSYLQDKIASAHLALLALEATPDNMVSTGLADQLLNHVGAYGVELTRPDGVTRMLGRDMPPKADAAFDLRKVGFFDAIWQGLATLAQNDNRVLQVSDLSPKDQVSSITMMIDEAPLGVEMWRFAQRILQLSIVISLLTAALVFFSLRWLVVRPMRRVTVEMMAFRDNPEDASRPPLISRRRDEIGVVHRQLLDLQAAVRQALRQRARLAALGTAVTKINHDLRNMLATARLVSDRLADSDDPEVRRVAQTLLASIDRAVALCSRTLDFTREGPTPLQLTRFPLAEVVSEVAASLAYPDTHLDNLVPPALIVEADREQVFRVLLNLSTNAAAAGATTITVAPEIEPGLLAVQMRDDGPGLPPKARENLFKPFAGSARPGGTGLGLAIARELIRAHGGDIMLVDSTGQGTVFRLTLPHALMSGLAAAQ